MSKVEISWILEALEEQRRLLEGIHALLYGGQWTCGCGHVNGSNLNVCAKCGRAPGAIA